MANERELNKDNKGSIEAAHRSSEKIAKHWMKGTNWQLRKDGQKTRELRILVQILGLQVPLHVLVTVKGGHPKQDPARHVLEVAGTQGELSAPWKEIVSEVDIATSPEVAVCDDLRATTSYSSYRL